MADQEGGERMARLIDADALCRHLSDWQYGSMTDGKHDVEYGVIENVIEGIEKEPTIDAEPHWIPVSERLPEAPFGCLVTVEDEEPMTGALFPNLLPYFVGWDGEQWNDGDGEQCPFEVLAWMPLPKPYEVKK